MEHLENAKSSHFVCTVREKLKQNKRVATLKSTLLALLQHLFSVDKEHVVESSHYNQCIQF